MSGRLNRCATWLTERSRHFDVRTTYVILPASPSIWVTCLAWSLDNNLTRKLSSGDPVQIAMFKGPVAGTVNVALAELRRLKVSARASLNEEAVQTMQIGVARIASSACSY
ncbi:MAG: hypothetical protein BGO83_17980 [Devosia sp. 66-14]|nr:MAG: hypothetical protein ABS47_11005 [Devosia sp. SCN 66-27]OJX22682.1 MAG: hypothetical protein BGO83_17980 [Devosia sp. 66-14]